MHIEMAFQTTAKKIRRNVEDYGWKIAVQKSFARAFSVVYEKRVYRIYRINIQEREASPPQSDRFTFRLLTKDDRDAFRQIGEMAEWLADDLDRKLAGQDMCLAAFDGENVAGFNLITFGDVFIPVLNMHRTFRSSDAWSEHIGVNKNYRKMGLASQLRYGVLKELKEKGLKRLYGGALTSNIASLKLARKIGFKEFVEVHYTKLFGFDSWRYKRVRT